ncbi:MAG: hypothetical protein K6T83_17415 [Alicyclobacillus sp.]|nr:hypothetical protein [Alicyclobacillus sp.]
MVDSFHTSAIASKMSEYTLIQSAARKICRFMEKRNPEAYAKLRRAMNPDVFCERMPEHGTMEAKAKQFHRVAVFAYGLLVHAEKLVHTETGWKHKGDPEQCEELVSLLRRVLEENVETVEDDDDIPSDDTGQGSTGLAR